MGQRYRVVLDVQSNFAGEPDAEVERKTIKSYLESFAGVGVIEVVSVEPAVDEVAQTEPWMPEPSTRRDVRKSRASRVSKRPKKM